MRKHCKYTYERGLQNLSIAMVDKLPLCIIVISFRHTRTHTGVPCSQFLAAEPTFDWEGLGTEATYNWADWRGP